MKVLVTGSSGFIGQHVRKALTARGHETVGYDSTNGKSNLDLSVLQESTTLSCTASRTQPTA